MFPPTFFNSNFKILIADLASEMRLLGFGELTIKSWIEKVIDVEDYHTLLESISRYRKAVKSFGDSQE